MRRWMWVVAGVVVGVVLAAWAFTLYFDHVIFGG